MSYKNLTYKNKSLKNNCSHFILGLSLLGTSFAFSNFAFAQSKEVIIVTGKANKYVAKNIVTATKTDTALINVPQSINVVTREVLDDQASRSISDTLHYVAGVTIGQGEGNRDQIAIRGQITTADFFLDGVRDDVQYYRGLYNIERIEVLKGPYALIFGRGGGGGIVNRVQKAPIAGNKFIKTRTSFNSFGAYDFNFDYNHSNDSESAFRINGVFEHLENHRDYYGGERYAINPYYAKSLNENWNIGLSYEYVKDERVTDRGIPSKNMLPLEGYEKQFFGVPGINETGLEANIVKVRLDGNFTKNLQSTTTILYGDYDKFYTNVYPNKAVSATNIVELDAYKDPTKRENFLFQSNLVWNLNFTNISHTIMGGVEYSNQKTQNHRLAAVFTPSKNFDLNSRIFPNISFGAKSRDTISNVEVLSLYLQDQISLNDKFLIIAGLRFDNFDIDGRDIKNAFDFARKDEEISPRIGLIYKFNPQTSLYASHSKSFLPRSGEQFISLNLSTQNLEPEEFTNEEIGFKWDVSNALTFNIAAFDLKRTNATTPNPTNVTQTINIGETITRGVETSLVGKLNEKWSISASMSYQDAYLKGNKNVKMAQVPKYQSALWNKYQFNPVFGLGLGIINQSSFYATIRTNGTATVIPEFSRIDAAAFVKLNDNLNLQLNVENLLNETYYDNAHNNNNISPGAPTNIRISISTKF